MSDWDFLHDMYDEGYSSNQISEAMTCGYNPYSSSIKPYMYHSDDLCDSPDVWEVVDAHELISKRSLADPELVTIFDNLVNNAESFFRSTSRYLQIWGELGELYAEIEYGIKRHKPHTQGSDGKIGNDFIEIKTISPEKNNDEVTVKRAGNFNKLLIVKINKDFTFGGQLICRKNLSKGEGKHVKVSWSKI